MSLDLDPGQLPPAGDLTPASFALPRGPRVTFRVARLRDLDSVRTLAENAGVVCEELELARLVRSDPATRMVLCATPIDAPDTVVGIGVIELGRPATVPTLLLVDTERTGGLVSLMADVLVGRARALADARVA